VGLFLWPWTTSFSVFPAEVELPGGQTSLYFDPIVLAIFYALSFGVVLYLRSFFAQITINRKCKILGIAIALKSWLTLALPPLNPQPIGFHNEYINFYGFPNQFLRHHTDQFYANIGDGTRPLSFFQAIMFDPLALFINILCIYLLILLFYKFIHDLLGK